MQARPGNARRLSLTLALALTFGLAGLASAAAAAGPGNPPQPVGLPFRGWGLTSNYQLVKVFGNGSQYSVNWYADLSALPWNTAVTYWGDDGGLASDPWNPNYLYVTVPINWALTELYQFDLTTNSLSYVTNYPSGSTQTGWNYALQGLGARCKSRLAARYGGVPFFANRRTHPVHMSYVVEITTAGVEATVIGPTVEYRAGDNTQDFFSGPHWFTFTTYDNFGNTSWGVDQMGSPTVVMGALNDGKHPTGLLAYGGGRFYVSLLGPQMYLVDTSLATSGPLSYVAWGANAYPTAPDLIDLSNVANFCRPLISEPEEPPVEPVDPR